MAVRAVPLNGVAWAGHRARTAARKTCEGNVTHRFILGFRQPLLHRLSPIRDRRWALPGGGQERQPGPDGGGCGRGLLGRRAGQLVGQAAGHGRSKIVNCWWAAPCRCVRDVIIRVGAWYVNPVASGVVASSQSHWSRGDSVPLAEYW